MFHQLNLLSDFVFEIPVAPPCLGRTLIQKNGSLHHSICWAHR